MGNRQSPSLLFTRSGTIGFSSVYRKSFWVENVIPTTTKSSRRRRSGWRGRRERFTTRAYKNLFLDYKNASNLKAIMFWKIVYYIRDVSTHFSILHKRCNHTFCLTLVYHRNPYALYINQRRVEWTKLETKTKITSKIPSGYNAILCMVNGRQSVQHVFGRHERIKCNVSRQRLSIDRTTFRSARVLRSYDDDGVLGRTAKR